MGAGKSTIGRLLAKELRLLFKDSDKEIELRCGANIPWIFDKEGEPGFRDREQAMIAELCEADGVVLATGGGAVMREENRQKLRTRGIVVYLHAHPETLLNRTRHDSNRPLLQVENPLAKLQELYDIRDSIYRSTAHIVFDVNRHSCQKTIQQLLHTLHARK